MTHRAFAFAAALLAGCTASEEKTGPGDELKKQALATYADIVYASYVDARDAGAKLKTAVDAFVDKPDSANHAAAKAAWLAARIPYGQTEVYRFYDGPIDNATDGPEGLLNSWPLDEGHIDYVKDNDKSGIINMPEKYPSITDVLLKDLNGNPGETDIASGYHAIEFLLWGQDLTEPAEKKPGQRAYADYATGSRNHERRGTYLQAAATLLVENLDQLVAAWKPSAANYRADFLKADPDSSLAKILIGMGSLGGAELAGERMTVAMENADQEDEHSCFSDNTHSDIVLNAQGISNVYNGVYEKADGTEVQGTGLYEVAKAADAILAEKLKAQLAESLAKAKAIAPPFDYAISLDNAEGRKQVKAAVDAFKAQTLTVADAAAALGLKLNLE